MHEKLEPNFTIYIYYSLKVRFYAGHLNFHGTIEKEQK